MKRSSLPFRTRLLLYFLIAGIIPLTACVTTMLAIFRTAVASSERSAAQSRISVMTQSLHDTVSGCDEILERL